MPSIKVVPTAETSRIGYTQVQNSFGPGAPGAIQIVARTSESAAVTAALHADHGIATVMPAQTDATGTRELIQAIPATGPSDPAVGATINRLRSTLPNSALVGGAVAENHDLEIALSRATPWVIGIVMTLGFLLLLVALQTPVIAIVGVATNLLATGAAFGVARLIIQDGHGAGLLGFQSQGSLCAWGPVLTRSGLGIGLVSGSGTPQDETERDYGVPFIARAAGTDQFRGGLQYLSSCGNLATRRSLLAVEPGEAGDGCNDANGSVVCKASVANRGGVGCGRGGERRAHRGVARGCADDRGRLCRYSRISACHRPHASATRHERTGARRRDHPLLHQDRLRSSVPAAG
jgi:hypothetical protein